MSLTEAMQGIKNDLKKGFNDKKRAIIGGKAAKLIAGLMDEAEKTHGTGGFGYLKATQTATGEQSIAADYVIDGKVHKITRIELKWGAVIQNGILKGKMRDETTSATIERYKGEYMVFATLPNGEERAERLTNIGDILDLTKMVKGFGV